MSFRKISWTVAGYLQKHRKILLIGGVIGIIFFTNLQRILNFIPKPKPIYYIGRIIAGPGNQLPSDIQQLVSSGLTSVDEAGNISSALAQSWTISDDGKTYSFTLDTTKRFQNDQPVLSTDINYNFKDVEIERPSDNQIVFHLPEPFAPFLAANTQPVLKTDKKRFLLFFKRTFLFGTKDYIITKLATKNNQLSSATLDSADEKRIYRFYPTEEAAILAFKLGKVDRLEGISNPKELKDWNQTSITSKTQLNQYVALFFNTADPALADKSSRQGLAYAIPDKAQQGIRVISPIHPESWAYNPQVKPYDYDSEAATELLTTQEESAPKIAIELTTTPTYLSTAETIKTAWQEFGITVKLKITNFPDPNNYQTLLIGQNVPPDPDQYSLWHSTQGTNITHYQSPKVDKLLEDGRKTTDQDDRKKIYQDFQRFLLEDLPVVFLFHRSSYTVERE